MSDALPDVFTSLSKFHTIEDHYSLLASIDSDSPVAIHPARKKSPDLFATAKRYLLIHKHIVIRDRLIDFIHSEGSFTPHVKRVMYFVFMFRDKRCRDFICKDVANDRGKWNTSVFRATHTRFFPQAGGHKALTNLRHLLFQTGILDQKAFQVNMGDLQKWLPVALEIAAEHLEPDSRTRLIASPHGFLIRNRLNALVNCTAEEITQIMMGGDYEDAADLMPEIELAPGESNYRESSFKTWQRQPPAKRQARRYDYSSDSVAFERAHHQHWLLEHLTARALSLAATKILTNQLVDMLATHGSNAILFEMKSCSGYSIRAQTRRAISQLLEYRFLHRAKLPDNTNLCVVLERKPRGGSEWLLQYAESLDIGMIWKEDNQDQLVCSHLAYQYLKKIGAHTHFKIDR